MLFPLSDDPDLFFKVVARLFLYDGAHLVTECQHISAGSAAKVYHKAAVLIADGCAAVAIGLLVEDIELGLLLWAFGRFMVSSTLLGWVFLLIIGLVWLAKPPFGAGAGAASAGGH